MKAYAYKFTFKKRSAIDPNIRLGVFTRIVLGDSMKTAMDTFELAYPPLNHSLDVVAIDNLGQLADSRDTLSSLDS